MASLTRHVQGTNASPSLLSALTNAPLDKKNAVALDTKLVVIMIVILVWSGQA